jgi:hypothetical protein
MLCMLLAHLSLNHDAVEHKFDALADANADALELNETRGRSEG